MITKNKKLIIACVAILGLILLCCCSLLIITYAAGIKNYEDLKQELKKESEDLDDVLEELEDSKTESEDEATDENFDDEDKPGDDGEQDPNAGDGTELVIMEDGTQYQIYLPKPNGLISSPLTVTGQISGSWYFEGSFPIELRDYDGNVLATGIAQAQTDWMTEDLVEYQGTLTFTIPASETYAELYLIKDNPSGLPENDDQIRYPVRFR